jgi:hypothetical protein
VYKERKTVTSSDYADNQYVSSVITPTTNNSIQITTPSLPPGVSILPGWTITQSSSGAQARIVSVTTAGAVTTLLLDKIKSWDATPVTIYTPIKVEVQSVQIDCDNPGMNKQFTEMVYIFSEQGFTSLKAKISSNTISSAISDTLTPTIRGGWGVDSWGDNPWGGVIGGQGKIRRFVPQKVARAGWLFFNISNSEAFSSFGFSGIQVYYRNNSTRQK